MSALPIPFYTVDDYFELEDRSDTRHEYIDGQIAALADELPDHALIVANVSAQVSRSVRQRHNERMYGSNLRIRVKQNQRYSYADGVLVCGAAETGPNQVLLNPTVIFEVLSNSTQEYDMGDKARAYRHIDSLQAMVFIAQIEAWVMVVERIGGQWVIRDYEGLEAVITLTSVGCTLTLSELYAKVEFPAPPPDEPL